LKILIATDGTPASTRMLEQIDALTPRVGRNVILLHVNVPAATLATMGPAPSVTPPRSVTFIDHGRHYLAAAGETLKAQGIEARSVQRTGEPWRTILDVVAEENADLLVVGSNHFGVLARLVEGSVSEKLATHCTIPLLIIP
jgi:nucleotide-binding universal stress UspA family protein